MSFWPRELAIEAATLLRIPWRGGRSKRARVLLERAVAEIERLRRDNERLQREVDRATFTGAALGPDGNLGPSAEVVDNGTARGGQR